MYSEKGNNLQLKIFQSSFDTFSIQMLNEKPMCNSKNWNSTRKTVQVHLELNKSNSEEFGANGIFWLHLYGWRSVCNALAFWPWSFCSCKNPIPFLASLEISLAPSWGSSLAVVEATSKSHILSIVLSSEAIRKATVKPGTPNSDHERSVLDIADVALFSAVVGQTPVVQLAWASFCYTLGYWHSRH